MAIVIPLVIILATSMVIMVRSWTLVAVSVAAIYALVGTLLWAGGGYPLSAAYLITGLTVGSVLGLTVALRRGMRRMPDRSVGGTANLFSQGISSMGWPPLGWFFMATTLVFCAVVAHGLSSTYPLREVRLASEWESFVSYWLLITGALTACITRDPLRSGLGLLLLLCGASASYILIAESFRFTGVVGMLLISVLLTLVISYLSVGRFEEMPPEIQVE